MTAKFSHLTPCSPDAAALAAAVRELAQTAHRTLHDPIAGPVELRELMRRIARLQARLGASSGNPLAAWLESLNRKVELRERTARLDVAPPHGAPAAGCVSLACSGA
jgi:hypothetical protein